MIGEGVGEVIISVVVVSNIVEILVSFNMMMDLKKVKVLIK